MRVESVFQARLCTLVLVRPPLDGVDWQLLTKLAICAFLKFALLQPMLGVGNSGAGFVMCEVSNNMPPAMLMDVDVARLLLLAPIF